MNERRQLETLVERYLSNQATEAELRVFMHLLQQGKLDDLIRAHMDRAAFSPEELPKTKPWRSWLNVAASVALIALASVWIYRQQNALLNWIHPTAYLRVQTGNEEQKAVKLADGSVVRLNAGSLLEYPRRFSNGPREVRLLAGEAFFDIVKTADHQRFIVKTPEHLDVLVLGTRFNISTRHHKTQVYLQTGKVRLSNAAEETLLDPGHLAEYDQNEEKISVHRATDELWLAWMTDLFVFDDVPLAEVSRAIEDYFGVHVIITDEALARQRFTGKVSRKNINVLLRILSKTLRIEITKRNKSIVMQPIPSNVE